MHSLLLEYMLHVERPAARHDAAERHPGGTADYPRYRRWRRSRRRPPHGKPTGGDLRNT